MNKENIVYFHGNCFDGFTSAWVARHVLGDDADYVPVVYGQPLPPVEQYRNKNVFVLDFSWPRDVCMAMEEAAKSLLILDHHKTAEAELAGLVFARFNMNKCGARLAWEHFFESRYDDHDYPPSTLVEYIEDHDLFKFQLRNSKAIKSYIRSFPMTWETWALIDEDLRKRFEMCCREGEAIERVVVTMVQTMAANHRMIEIRGVKVPAANATIEFSAVNHYLLTTLKPESGIAAYWLDRADRKRQWGLCSRPDVDCSELAKLMGGGGHKNAAGFTEDFPGHKVDM